MVELNLAKIIPLLNRNFSEYRAERTMTGGGIEIKALGIDWHPCGVPLARIDYNNGKVIVRVLVEKTDHLKNLREMYNLVKGKMDLSDLEVDFIYNCEEEEQKDF